MVVGLYFTPAHRVHVRAERIADRVHLFFLEESRFPVSDLTLSINNVVGRKRHGPEHILCENKGVVIQTHEIFEILGEMVMLPLADRFNIIRETQGENFEAGGM